jgi:hypothetical protein
LAFGVEGVEGGGAAGVVEGPEEVGGAEAGGEAGAFVDALVFEEGELLGAGGFFFDGLGEVGGGGWGELREEEDEEGEPAARPT